MLQCYNARCPYKNRITGDCMSTACIQSVTTYIEPNRLEFPQTIGNTTFYTKNDLMNWVLKQQRRNNEIINILISED